MAIRLRKPWQMSVTVISTPRSSSVICELSSVNLTGENGKNSPWLKIQASFLTLIFIMEPFTQRVILVDLTKSDKLIQNRPYSMSQDSEGKKEFLISQT